MPIKILDQMEVVGEGVHCVYGKLVSPEEQDCLGVDVVVDASWAYDAEFEDGFAGEPIVLVYVDLFLLVKGGVGDSYAA